MKMKKNTHKWVQKLSPHINRELVLQFAAHTLVNGYDLRSAAEDLFEIEQYGLARSLAISGREEFGKFFISLLYLSNQIPLENFLAVLREHSPKQALGTFLVSLASLINPSMPELKALVDVENNYAPDAIRDFVEQFAKNLDTSQTDITDQFQMIAKKMINASQGEDERKRQEGVYVSLEIVNEDVQVHYPRSITKTDAEAELDALEKFVEPAEALWVSAELDDDDTVDLKIEKLIVLLDQICRPEILNDTAFAQAVPEVK